MCVLAAGACWTGGQDEETERQMVDGESKENAGDANCSKLFKLGNDHEILRDIMKHHEMS